jgi:hypothetical protein
MKSYLVTKPWFNLYEVIGDQLFSHLLKEYMIFIPSKDDSLVQISGPNLFQYLSDNFGKDALYE